MQQLMPVKLLKTLAIGAAVLTFAGCATLARTDFPVTVEDQAALELQNVNIIRLTPQNIRSYRTATHDWHPEKKLPASPASWQYLIGIGDVLSITVWDHPELTLPAGPERSQIESGSWVNSRGDIFYPFIGGVKAAGRMIGDIQQELTERLGEFITDPQIEVKVAEFNSQRVVLTGAVARPGTMKISNIPLSLIEAVNGAGGLLPEADSRHVTIQRAGQTYYVNLRAFVSNGRAANNPLMQGGDIVNVPVLENNVAYILGQVAQPGLVDLGINGLSLTEALVQRGGLDESFADAQGIFVFRNTANGGFDVFQLDATTPLAFVLATNFVLHPQDVIYVVTDPVAKWNAVITSLLPSMALIRGVDTIAGGV